MQAGKNNNRFRKLIPTNNRHINPTTAQIYSAQFKLHSGSQSKIETVHSNSHKTNFHSLQRESGEDLKSLRQRQIIERRLKTISAAAFEGQKQTHEFNDHNMKRKNNQLVENRVEDDGRNRLSQLMDLIVQFKFKTDSIFKYQEEEVPNQTEAKREQYVNESIFEEQVYELINKTRQSSLNLMAIYLNRIIRQIMQDAINCLTEYEGQALEEQISQQMKDQTDNYLVADIGIGLQKDEGKGKRNPKGRGNLMDVNKFFDRQ